MKFSVILSSIFLLAIIGCTSDTIQTADVRILLTDMPSTRYDSIVISLHQVNLWCGCETTPEIVVSTEKQNIDVLALRNGTTMVLGSAKPEARNYKHIKLYLDSGFTVRNGIKRKLVLPGGPQIIDIRFLEAFEIGKSYDMILDFDAARSILDSSNGIQYLRPVIRAVLRNKSGAISGTVTKWATVWATMPADTTRDTLTTYTLFSTPPNSFAFGFLNPGTYSIGAIDSMGNRSAPQTQQVSAGVSTGNVTITIP